MTSPLTCPHCEERFESRKALFDHLRLDNCKDLVATHSEIYEARDVEQHQMDLADFADWGEA